MGPAGGTGLPGEDGLPRGRPGITSGREGLGVSVTISQYRRLDRCCQHHILVRIRFVIFDTIQAETKARNSCSDDGGDCRRVLYRRTGNACKNRARPRWLTEGMLKIVPGGEETLPGRGCSLHSRLMKWGLC